MALSDKDLDRIEQRLEGTVERVVEQVVERVIDDKQLATKEDLGRVEARLETRIGRVESRLGDVETRIERMESRVLFGMSLLERDGFDRLEDHEARIRKLEKLQTS